MTAASPPRRHRTVARSSRSAWEGGAVPETGTGPSSSACCEPRAVSRRCRRRPPGNREARSRTRVPRGPGRRRRTATARWSRRSRGRSRTTGRNRRRSRAAARTLHGCERRTGRCASGSAWSSPLAVKPIAVGMRAGSVQPASPDTMWSIAMPRFVISLAMPWKSAGVGAGARRRDRPARSDQRRGQEHGSQRQGSSTEGHRCEAITDTRDRRSALPGAPLGFSQAGHRVGRGGCSGRRSRRR